MRRSTVYSRTYLSSDWTPFRSKTLESLCRAKSQQKWMYSFSSPLTLTYSASTCVKNGWPFTTLPTSTTRLSVWLKKTWLLYRKSSDMLRNGLLVKLWARYLSTVTVYCLLAKMMRKVQQVSASQLRLSLKMLLKKSNSKRSHSRFHLTSPSQNPRW
jgi:hypothetical protein